MKTEETKTKPAYYAIIPADVRYSDIPANAKLLYGEITALCNEQGFCWATNAYFAELYKVNITTISEWVKILKNKGFITYQLEQKTKRKIYLTLREKPKGGRQKAEGYPSGKAEDNNTSVITTTNNSLPAEPAERELGPIEQVFEIFYRSINPNINYGNKTNRAAAEWLIHKYTLEKTLEAARYACSVQNQQFAPTITTPYQLKEKMAALIKFKLGQQEQKGIKVAS